MGLRVGLNIGQGVPVFISGSTHVAHLLITNLSTSSVNLRVYFEYFAEVYGDGYHKWDMTIPAGGSEDRSGDVEMPISPGRYKLRIQVYDMDTYERVFLEYYEVDIEYVGPLTETVTVVWDNPQPFPCGSEQYAYINIVNDTGVAFYHDYDWYSWLDPNNWEAGYAFWGLGTYAILEPGEVSNQRVWRTMSDVPGTYPHWIEIFDRYTGDLVGIVTLDDITLK